MGYNVLMNEKSLSKKTAIIYMILVGILAFTIGSLITSTIPSYEGGSVSSVDNDCNVLGLTINGTLSTYLPEQISGEWGNISSSEYIVDGLSYAQESQNIKGVIISIDSTGGDGVAGEEIANALKSLSKPNVAVIRSIGASAAYWAATGADRIFASKLSDVGSIAITSSYLDESSKTVKEGYKYVELSSGKYKDLGDPSRPLTTEERNIVLSDLRKIHEVFVQVVADNRNLEKGEVDKLANGLTYVGTDALNYGLIDEIGDVTSAKKYIEEIIGEGVEVCWY